MNQEMRERLNRIYKHFGKDTQDRKFSEECDELNTAYRMSFEFPEVVEFGENVIDEKADVFIQSMQHYLNDPAVQERVNFKLDRTEERMQSGYYEE